MEDAIAVNAFNPNVGFFLDDVEADLLNDNLESAMLAEPVVDAYLFILDQEDAHNDDMENAKLTDPVVDADLLDLFVVDEEDALDGDVENAMPVDPVKNAYCFMIEQGVPV